MLIDLFVFIFRELQYEIREDVRSDLKKRRGLNKNRLLANKYDADINYIGRKKTGAKQARRCENCKLILDIEGRIAISNVQFIMPVQTRTDFYQFFFYILRRDHSNRQLIDCFKPFCLFPCWRTIEYLSVTPDILANHSFLGGVFSPPIFTLPFHIRDLALIADLLGEVYMPWSTLVPCHTFWGFLYPCSPKGGWGILFYLCPSKIFFVAFFSVTVDGRNLIFGHKRHIGIPYCG